MGGGGKGGAEGKAATVQSRLAAELFRQSGPVREELFGVPTNPNLVNPPVPPGTGGGLLSEILQPIGVEPLPPVQTLPTARETAEQQFKVAETNIMRSTPRGGLQQRLLGDINIARAQEVTRQAVGQKEAIRQQEIAEIARREEAERTRAGRIFQAATPALGQTQLAIGGLGQAGATQAALAGQQAQSQAGFLGQLAQGVGFTAGMKAGTK